jgi:hypothetical protein
MVSHGLWLRVGQQEFANKLSAVSMERLTIPVKPFRFLGVYEAHFATFV